MVVILPMGRSDVEMLDFSTLRDAINGVIFL